MKINRKVFQLKSRKFIQLENVSSFKITCQTHTSSHPHCCLNRTFPEISPHICANHHLSSPPSAQSCSAILSVNTEKKNCGSWNELQFSRRHWQSHVLKKLWSNLQICRPSKPGKEVNENQRDIRPIIGKLGNFVIPWVHVLDTKKSCRLKRNIDFMEMK